MDKKYSSYATVGQKWVEKIPAHWEMNRLKGVFALRKERNNPIQTDFILSLTAKQGVVPYAEKEGTGGNKPKDDLSQYNICRENDLLVNCMNVVSGAAGVSRYYGAISPVYYAFYLREHGNIWYYHYIFRLITFQRSLVGLGKGILMHESDEGVLTSVRMRISMNYLGNVMLPVPPLAEQNQIVKYLDWKVSEINQLINCYNKQIKALSELKAKIIDNVTVKGLRNEKLRHNDDINWDIDYPSHWRMQRMRESFKFRKGLTITKANLEESGIPVISYGQVHSKQNSGVGLCEELLRYVNPNYLDTSASALVAKNDFIFADTSEDVAGCGNCAFIDCDDVIFAGYHSVTAHPLLAGNIKYLAYLFQSTTWRYQIRKKVNAVKVYSITQRILKDTFILLPPRDEQDEIVEYLDDKCSSIDSFVVKIEEKIQQLRDLKNSLISDVVTGQIDVRNVVVPEYEYVEKCSDAVSDSDDELENVTDEED